jgi:predicted secreted protein
MSINNRLTALRKFQLCFYVICMMLVFCCRLDAQGRREYIYLDGKLVAVEASDTVSPGITITSPTSNATYSTSSTPITLGGTASDNVGVTQVTWINNRGGSGTCSGTTTWTCSNIALQTGSNVLTVTAKDAANNSGTDTLTVTYTDVTVPTITITSPTTDTTYSTASTPITLGGTASDNVGVTQVTWVNNRGGSGTCSGTTTWTCGNIALQSGSNVLTVTAKDAANNNGVDSLTVTYEDVGVPTITIASPTTNPTYSTASMPITLGGMASDNVGVTQVTWVNDRGGSGTCSGTTTWTCSNIALQSGSNILTVTARDAANNTGTDVLTVTYTPQDTVSPTTAITSPTTGTTYSTTSTPITLGGTASDNVGVTQVTWVNDRGGSGTCSGTTTWTCSNIALQTGSNMLTVTAKDAANNSGTDTLTVTYTDVTVPTITITSPTTDTTYSTASTPITLGGIASDNVGVTQVTWINNRGGSGTCSGTTTWTCSNIALQTGSNVLTVTAKDAANNSGTDTLTVTYTDVTVPTITITSPTTDTTYSTASTPITLGGTASDNVGVTQVNWVNNRGGFGTCSGTTTWTCSNIALQTGSNVLTVTAKDAANNSGTDALTVTFTGCAYDITPDFEDVPTNYPVTGLEVNVITGSSCSWTAVSNNGWIIITSGSSGTGNGTVVYRVTKNNGGARTGTMTIAGQTFTVYQEGP